MDPIYFTVLPSCVVAGIYFLYPKSHVFLSKVPALWMVLGASGSISWSVQIEDAFRSWFWIPIVGLYLLSFRYPRLFPVVALLWGMVVGALIFGK